MSYTLAQIIQFGMGCIIIQDSVASMAFYKGREGRKNQAFRTVRLIVGIIIALTAVGVIGG